MTFISLIGRVSQLVFFFSALRPEVSVLYQWLYSYGAIPQLHV